MKISSGTILINWIATFCVVVIIFHSYIPEECYLATVLGLFLLIGLIWILLKEIVDLLEEKGE